MSETTEQAKFADEVMAGVEAIKPILAGKGPELQSAILADLTSIWLCGIQTVDGDKESILEARRWALKAYMDLVVDLTASGVNEPKGGNN